MYMYMYIYIQMFAAYLHVTFARAKSQQDKDLVALRKDKGRQVAKRIH